MAIVYSCKRVYSPPAINTNSNYLVVEGVINSGADSTFIKLSQTVKLSSKSVNAPVSGAVVTVESDQNTTYPLIESAKGTYVSSGLNLDNTRQYRLDIKMPDGKVYQSDFVQVVNSPPIDSINYVIGSNGLNIYASTHDPKNNTHYYRWSYQETWIIHSFYDSQFASNGDTVLPRDQSNNIFKCWESDTASSVLLASSAKLTKDVIVNNPLIFISDTSEKFTEGYSILITQYAMTSDAYNFWTNLKKNTEQLGSIFDAQPSEINGNIHCITNPAVPVVGYISVGSTVSQRIFIQQRQLPSWSPDPNYYHYCVLLKGCCSYSYYEGAGQYINQVDAYMNYTGNEFAPLIPIDAVRAPPFEGPIIGFTTTSIPICVDCRVRGGVNKAPAYWQF